MLNVGMGCSLCGGPLEKLFSRGLGERSASTYLAERAVIENDYK